jgi:hypothetical protein
MFEFGHLRGLHVYTSDEEYYSGGWEGNHFQQTFNFWHVCIYLRYVELFSCFTLLVSCPYDQLQEINPTKWFLSGYHYLKVVGFFFAPL